VERRRVTEEARLLVHALRDPKRVKRLSPAEWTPLIAVARAESLLGSLAHRLHGVKIPQAVEPLLASARRDAEQARRQALWEAEMARRALAPLQVPVILLKGTAYAAAGLEAAEGRSIGDLDILVPRLSLPQVEQALLEAGWEWVKEDDYDSHYYREWMHELPPLIHRERDRMIDVHHTILPLTHRRTPDADALIEGSVALESGLRILSPEDMVVHSAAHMIADGDLAGGLRNLWDIDRLLRGFATRNGFWADLEARAEHHQLLAPVRRAARLAASIYQTPIPEGWKPRQQSDRLFEARLFARNGWGQATSKPLRLAFYVRSHWMRMPPMMLARHLWKKGWV
jgi:hypothetical protein